ncbi:MAG: prephenate dehydratase [Deltaproteobacteria bacterium]|nr:prephenate dehydratase [Deltaproteobacteria bacterium]
MTIDELRARIDALDAKLVELLDERARVARDIGELKREDTRAIHDPEREERVIERAAARLAALPDPVFPGASIRPVMREIMSACLSVEEAMKVAYLGPAGTFSHLAARRAFGLAARYAECATIDGVFDAVERGHAAYGVVPFENSTEGGVSFTLDRFLSSRLRIRRELVLEVTHCLLANGADLSRIARVYSHPQALAQCRSWLARNLPSAQLIASSSTTSAVREAESDEAGAAIASRLAAESSSLEVVREGVQDHPHNATRFVILAAEDAPPTGDDRTSIVFSSPDERGALRRVLEVFDDEGINLSRIESRPARDRAWQYVFFTDLDGHRDDPAVARALARIAERCQMVEILGSYPRAR